MIDTIVLLLTQDKFTITAPDKFSPTAYLLLTSPAWNHGIKCKQNPTKKELLQGIYKPRLTLFLRDYGGSQGAPFEPLDGVI